MRLSSEKGNAIMNTNENYSNELNASIVRCNKAKDALLDAVIRNGSSIVRKHKDEEQLLRSRFIQLHDITWHIADIDLGFGEPEKLFKTL